jgi:lysophospholipase L1-like esterase
MPVISRGVPAFTSGGYTADSAANDSSYTADWLSRGLPAWVALDLSGVPASQRGQVVVVWYNTRTYGFDASVLNNATYSLVGSYTIDAHGGPGGGQPPTPGDPGWVTLATVDGNQLNSRQHLVDLAGHNWVRMYMTAPCDRNVNANPAEVGLNLDVHDAHLGAEDDWLFVGDSITATGWRTPGTFAQGVNAVHPSYFPLVQGAGIGYQTAASTAPRLPGWLADFPGRYVALALGTNDANRGLMSASALDAFYTSYETMVQAVLAAGKVPVVPTIICSSSTTIQANLPALNARLATLKQNYPEVVSGPDLYGAFQGHPELFSDTIHPNDEGYALLRSKWVEAMLATVYPPP